MKPNQNQSSMQQQTSNWSLHQRDPKVRVYSADLIAVGPKPPTAQAIERAQFKDRTFRWNGK